MMKSRICGKEVWMEAVNMDAIPIDYHIWMTYWMLQGYTVHWTNVTKRDFSARNTPNMADLY